ncbi:chaplin [Streptomyces sp. NPDC058676]|uniref:chaplin n=1 Tax=unclassified Streptomyces TaxID=2593676 RepID=UPI003646D50D
MRRVTRNGVIAVAAASGAMAVAMPAYASSGADGAAAGSPGVISGNTVQIPVHIPVNVCGNTVNVVGLLNPAVGNSCANGRDGRDGGGGGGGGGDAAGTPERTATDGGATANGVGKDSPGVLSGNVAQLPVHVPVNLSGNSANVVGIGNAAVGNESVNTSGGRPEGPRAPEQPAPKPTPSPRAHAGPQAPPPAPQPHFTAELAETGADQALSAIVGSAALILGGAVVYRRSRPRAMR